MPKKFESFLTPKPVSPEDQKEIQRLLDIFSKGDKKPTYISNQGHTGSTGPKNPDGSGNDNTHDNR